MKGNYWNSNYCFGHAGNTRKMLNRTFLLHILPKFTFLSFAIMILVCPTDTTSQCPGTEGRGLFEKIIQMCSTLYFELEPCSLYIVTFPQNKKEAEAQNSKPTIRSCAHRMLRLLTFFLTSASFVFQDLSMTIIIL